MYKAYLAGLSGQSVQFTSLTEAEAAAFALGASDKANIHSPKSRRQPCHRRLQSRSARAS